MKKIVLTLFAFSIFLFPLLGEKTQILETGPLLFVQPNEPCTVFIDGKDMGEAPLFVSNITRWSSRIELKSETSYTTAQIQFKPDKQKVTYFRPELSEYFGYLNISTNEQDAILYIDDQLFESSFSTDIRQNEGIHTIRIEKEGFFTDTRTINITRLETTNLNIALQQAVPLTFSPMLPEGSSIIITKQNAQKQLDFSTPLEEPIILSSGIWEIEIANPMFETIATQINVGNTPVQMELNVNFYNPGIRISQLRKDSIVYINGEILAIDIEDTVISSPVGINKIEVHTKGYLPIRREIELAGNQIFELALEYQKDPMVVRAKRSKTGYILLGSGLSLLAGGLVLNTDAVLVPNSPDYDTYSMLKYASLGIAGAGAATLLAGTGFTLPIILENVQ